MAGKELVIDKLRGSENYHTWKFAMQNLLDLGGMEKCIEDPVTETDAAKIRRAKAKIVLSVDESIYVHILKETTALDVWKKLQSLYDITGLTRKISLLRTLIDVRLEKCESMNDYIGQLVNAVNKLDGINFKIPDEWIGGIMLAGLSEEFKPFIMGIGSSGMELTGDGIKMKLLDGSYGTSATETAFFGAKKNI